MIGLMVAVPGDGGEVSVVVDVIEGDPNDFIPRDPSRRLLADE